LVDYDYPNTIIEVAMNKNTKSKKIRYSEAYTPTRGQYERLCPRYEALRDEGVFMLHSEIDNRGIKIHTIESRVKDYQSAIRKINSSALHGFGELVDVVGLRVICLFRSDLERVGEIIENLFNVEQKDDKISESTDSFGYMSVHYVCRFPHSYNGPRYDKIAGEVFEVQVRTLCMHAWAAVSHYLDYKAEGDIPDELKKGLNALSGLFYVADDQYEKLYNERLKSKRYAKNSTLDELLDSELNLDTFSAYIHKKFPDRDRSDLNGLSTLLENLKSFGYNSIGGIDIDLMKGLSEAETRDEKSRVERGVEKPPYYDLAMARISIHNGNPKFKNFEEAIERVELAVTE
jgi:putative GTP pyrophosphokinase